MDTDFIHQQVKLMRPSSFSEREQDMYQAEKKIMRQFLLMKEQDEVPPHLSVDNMKAWLLSGRCFLEEFQDIAERAEARDLVLGELAWTTARRHCLNHMEEELQEELHKEKQLSLQFGRKITLEGLQIFLLAVRAAAEEDIKAVLLSFFEDLQNAAQSFRQNYNVSSLQEKLQQHVDILVAEILRGALDSLLEEPQLHDQHSHTQCFIRAAAGATRAEVAAAAETGKLLADTVGPCLSEFTYFPLDILKCMSQNAAQDMVALVHGRFDERLRSFKLLDFDDSVFGARKVAISAIHHMDSRNQAAGEDELEEAAEFSEENSEPWAEEVLQQTEVISDKDAATREVCVMELVESHDDKKKKKKKKGVRAFLGRVWKMLKRAF